MLGLFFNMNKFDINRGINWKFPSKGNYGSSKYFKARLIKALAKKKKPSRKNNY